MEYNFEVYGKIKGKARPRINTYTSKAYTPTDTKDYEMLVKQYFKVKYPRYVPLTGRTAVRIKAYFVIPSSTTKKDKELIEQGQLSPTKKPDIDNIVKIILDALNKMAFEDDNQITKLEVEKVYTLEKEEKVEVSIFNY